MAGLEAQGELRRVPEPVSARLEMTAVSDFVLRAGGPAFCSNSQSVTNFRC